MQSILCGRSFLFGGFERFVGIMLVFQHFDDLGRLWRIAVHQHADAIDRRRKPSDQIDAQNLHHNGYDDLHNTHASAIRANMAIGAVKGM